MIQYTEHDALKAAIDAAAHCGCRKSQRGVAIFHRRFGLFSTGTNYPPAPFSCDGSKECRKVCNKICIHAEQHAMLKVGAPLVGYEMLHIEVVDGEAVPSGGPSCWQCSRIILAAKLERMWLLHEDGLRAYTAEEFHLLTLKEKKLYYFVPLEEEER